MTAPVAFTVRGTPVVQGNHKVVGRAGFARIVEKKASVLDGWRDAIATEARAAAGDAPMLEGPLVVTLTFALQRPASAPKKRRTWPVNARSGDLDKLARAALDAMTGVLFADDAQVVGLHVAKDYGDPGVTVVVQPHGVDGLGALDAALRVLEMAGGAVEMHDGTGELVGWSGVYLCANCEDPFVADDEPDRRPTCPRCEERADLRVVG